MQLTHTRAEGTLLTGTAPRDGAAPLLHTLGFKLSRRRAFWYVPRSRDSDADERLITHAAEALRAGGHTVTVTLDNDQGRSFADAEADRTQAAAHRADRFARYSDSAASSSHAHLSTASRMLKSIPPGQPILYDHYSANREIRFRERMRRHFEAGHADAQQAREWARRAQLADHYTAHRTHPGTTLRRIQRLESHLHSLENQQHTAVRQAVAGEHTAEQLVDLLAELNRRHHDVTDELGYWTHVVAAAETAGTKVWRPADFAVGDFARVCGRWVEVVRVNAKSLAVASSFERRAIVTAQQGARTGRVPFNNVTGRATADQITHLTGQES
nr:DUF3560 domain-containing protein [Streptomyces sp. SID14478]